MAVFTKPDARFFRQMLSGHSLLGLTAAFLMYVICVSGTLAVFYKEFWRWEQAVATVETMEIGGARIEQAIQHALDDMDTVPPSIGIDMPTSDWPRMSITYGDQRRYVAADGSLEGAVERPWTSFLARLHFALNLPLELGVVIVGIFGVLLTALIVSGFLAHPGILRDAFAWRLNRSRQLQQTDLHNRLSVWAAPFHLVIAVTGAILGLAGAISLVSALLSPADPVSPDSPAAQSAAAAQVAAEPLPDFDAVWQNFRSTFPGEEVFYLTLQNPRRAGQVVELSAIQPDRLYWSTSRRFAADGSYSETVGGDTASVGGKMQSSLYRLHFGHFGGMPIKIVFLLLGAATCIVTATGVNIWLAKRRQRKLPADTIDRLWQVSLWGTLVLIPGSAVTVMVLGIPPVPVFWFGLLLLALAAWRWGTPGQWSASLKLAAALTTAAVPLVHSMRFGEAAWQGGSLVINLVWLALAAALAVFYLTTSGPALRGVAREA